VPTPVPTGRPEIERRIIDLAQSDAEFRARLIDNPRAALAEIVGVEMPDFIEVRVVEERPDLICIVLPVDLSGMGRDAVWAMTGTRP